MKKMFLTFILAALILPACSGTPARPTITPIPPRPTPNAVELEPSDPTKTIEAAVGSDFTITVRTRPSSSGYHWELGEALDANIVEYVWKNYAPDRPGDPNSSGRDVWRFKAAAPGKTTITLGYYQGETTAAPLTMVFTVVVK